VWKSVRLEQPNWPVCSVNVTPVLLPIKL
jgi:hypothetical protein